MLRAGRQVCCSCQPRSSRPRSSRPRSSRPRSCRPHHCCPRPCCRPHARTPAPAPAAPTPAAAPAPAAAPSPAAAHLDLSELHRAAAQRVVQPAGGSETHGLHGKRGPENRECSCNGGCWRRLSHCAVGCSSGGLCRSHALTCRRTQSPPIFPALRAVAQHCSAEPCLSISQHLFAVPRWHGVHTMHTMPPTWWRA